MTQPVKKTDMHIVTQTPPGVAPGTPPPYGPNVYHIVNPNTGEIVNRVEGYSAALAAQAAANAAAAKNGQ